MCILPGPILSAIIASSTVSQASSDAPFFLTLTKSDVRRRKKDNTLHFTRASFFSKMSLAIFLLFFGVTKKKYDDCGVH